MRDHPGQRHHLLRRLGHGGRRHHAGALQDRAALSGVGAYQPGYHGDLHLARGHGIDHRLGHDVAAGDPAEDVHKHCAHVGIVKEDAQRRPHLVAVGASADVEEVCRLSPVQLDNVHGGHGQTCAVDQTADVSLQFDVAHAHLPRLGLRRHLGLRIVEGGQGRLAGEGVVVDDHLRVEGHELATLGKGEGVDLQQRAVLLEEGFVHGPDDSAERAGLGAGEADGPGQVAGLIVGKAQERIGRHPDDGLGRRPRHFFDVHAAHGADHDGHRLGGAVEHGPQVVLADDGRPSEPPGPCAPGGP